MPKSRTGKIVICPCGNKIYRKTCLLKDINYCSRACFYKYKKWQPWNKGLKGIHLSLKSEFKKGQSVGKHNNNWKGGRRIDKDGYISIWKPEHPNCSKQKRVPEHRLIMEGHLGRLLKQNEIIHHIDFNKINNKINNLFLTTLGYNSKLNSNMNRLMKELLKRKIVKFNKKTGEYFL